MPEIDQLTPDGATRHDGKRFFVITGGPGAGKTTLVQALAATGVAHSPEGARAIIRRQVATGGNALPWGDRTAYARLMLDHDVAAYHAAHALNGPVIFDRGVPDIVGYLTLCGLPVPEALSDAATRLRYNPTVFVAPYWPEIYDGDDERKQSADEAEMTCAVMIGTYQRLGFRPVMLPRASVADRVAFVRAVMDAA